jgi:hypothetical protein
MKTIRERIGAVWGTGWWWGSVRVAAFLGAVNLCLMAASLPTARAAAESAARRAGEQLLQQLGPSIIGEAQGVLVNGERLFVASRTTELAPDAVLSAFERLCRSGTAEWRDEVNRLPDAALLPERIRDVSNATTFRMDPDGKAPGQVACIVPRGDMHGVKGLMKRLSEFVATGDLSRLGDARLAVVRRDEKSRLTHVVALWSEGSFSLLHMFPEHGDAPGRDSPYAPRPRDAVRVLSAEIEGRAYAMRVYDTVRSRDEVLATYSREMAGAGWAAQPLPSTPAFEVNENVRAFQKNGTAVLVAVNRTPAEKTGVTLLEMGSPGFVRTAAR